MKLFVQRTGKNHLNNMGDRSKLPNQLRKLSKPVLSRTRPTASLSGKGLNKNMVKNGQNVVLLQDGGTEVLVRCRNQGVKHRFQPLSRLVTDAGMWVED